MGVTKYSSPSPPGRSADTLLALGDCRIPRAPGRGLLALRHKALLLAGDAAGVLDALCDYDDRGDSKSIASP